MNELVPYVNTILWGVVSFVFGLATVMNLRRISTLEEKVSNLHLTYAKREDVDQDFQEIKATLLRIETKIDRKQDK